MFSNKFNSRVTHGVIGLLGLNTIYNASFVYNLRKTVKKTNYEYTTYDTFNDLVKSLFVFNPYKKYSGWYLDKNDDTDDNDIYGYIPYRDEVKVSNGLLMDGPLYGINLRTGEEEFNSEYIMDTIKDKNYFKQLYFLTGEYDSEKLVKLFKLIKDHKWKSEQYGSDFHFKCKYYYYLRFAILKRLYDDHNLTEVYKFMEEEDYNFIKEFDYQYLGDYNYVEFANPPDWSGEYDYVDDLHFILAGYNSKYIKNNLDKFRDCQIKYLYKKRDKNSERKSKYIDHKSFLYSALFAIRSYVCKLKEESDTPRRKDFHLTIMAPDSKEPFDETIALERANSCKNRSINLLDKSKWFVGEKHIQYNLDKIDGTDEYMHITICYYEDGLPEKVKENFDKLFLIEK